MAKICNCPQCQQFGTSLAALYYRETTTSVSNGKFSGLGLGTHGIGVGFGSYQQNNITTTQRAELLKPPEKFYLSPLRIFINFFSLIIGLYVVVLILKNLSLNNSNFPSDFNQNLELFKNWICPFIVFVFLLTTLNSLKKNNQYENHLNQSIYQKQLIRYNELRYCEHCHVLYDHNGHYYTATSSGLEELMKLA